MATLTPTISRPRREVVEIQVTSTADTDSAVIDTKGQVNIYAGKAGLKIVRAAGTTDVVEVDLLGSADGVIYEDLVAITTSAATAITWSSSFSAKVFRYFKILTTTVGSGNTLTLTAILGES